jgi:hypothetical protein
MFHDKVGVARRGTLDADGDCPATLEQLLALGTDEHLLLAVAARKRLAPGLGEATLTDPRRDDLG